MLVLPYADQTTLNRNRDSLLNQPGVKAFTVVLPSTKLSVVFLNGNQYVVPPQGTMDDESYAEYGYHYAQTMEINLKSR